MPESGLVLGEETGGREAKPVLPHFHSTARPKVVDPKQIVGVEKADGTMLSRSRDNPRNVEHPNVHTRPSLGR